MSWFVTLTGASTGAEYIYKVGLPLGTPDHIAYNAAAEQHNRLLHDHVSTVNEGYRPPMTCEWRDDD